MDFWYAIRFESLDGVHFRTVRTDGWYHISWLITLSFQIIIGSLFTFGLVPPPIFVWSGVSLTLDW
jgi:hypothetical protein